MESLKNTRISAVDGSDRLIEAGAFSYVEALNALAEFRLKVQEKCTGALEGHLPDLSSAIGKSFSPQDIHRWPRDPVGYGLGTSWPWLYAGLTLAEAEEIYFGLGLYWDYQSRDTLTLVAMGTLEIDRRSLFAKTVDALGKRPELGLEKFPSGNRFFSLLEPIPQDDPLSFQMKLGGIATKWVGIWNKLGGLSGLLPELSKPKLQEKAGLRRKAST
jgi:hypothetical protein